MTSANGGTDAGRYPCDGWVDKLEPTLFTTVICFEENHEDSLINDLQEKTLTISY